MDLSLENRPGLEVESKSGRSWYPVSAAQLSELRLLAPIVGVWLAVFLLGIWHSRQANFEYFMITHCGIGVFMTVIWTSFYGSMNWKRIVVALSLVAVVAALGVVFVVFLEGFANDQIWALAWIPTFVAMASLIPMGAARRFWGWRIFHLRDAVDCPEQKRFNIRDTFVWTAYLAVVLTLLRFIISFDGDIDQNVWRFALLLLVGVCVPSITTVVFLCLVSRLKTLLLVVAVLLLAMCVAILISVLVLSAGDIDLVIREVFWPVQIWFTVAGFVLTGVIWFLRRRGLVFTFGVGNDPESLALAKSTYESMLRRRIATHERKAVRLRSELDKIHESLI